MLNKFTTEYVPIQELAMLAVQAEDVAEEISVTIGRNELIRLVNQVHVARKKRNRLYSRLIRNDDRVRMFDCLRYASICRQNKKDLKPYPNIESHKRYLAECRRLRQSFAFTKLPK